MRPAPRVLFVVLLLTAFLVNVAGQDGRATRPNILIFVADGLRHGSVTPGDTPALWRVRTEGVHFENSHSLFPTFTMANASAIATGRPLGDTGIYSNTIWPGFATFDSGDFDLLPGTPVPFIENDRVVGDLDAHFDGNVLGSATFLAEARAHGYRTAAVGKLGPVVLQDATAAAPVDGAFRTTLPGIVVDDGTGNAGGLPWPPDLVREMTSAGVPSAAPTRSNGYGPTSPFNNGYTGDHEKPGTLAANLVQQTWFAEVTTRFVLPYLTRDPETPFVLLFWSRDPDGSQHNHGDSLGALYPGINGPTSIAGVRNADRCLARLLEWLDAHPAIQANTDLFVTSDHGFATISRAEVDRTGRLTSSEAARHDYLGRHGGIDTPTGTLPFGFLGLDLAYDLQLSAFDPDSRVSGGTLFRKLRIGSSETRVPLGVWEHPTSGNALLAADVRRPDGSDARVIVAANGGSDLVYVPDGDTETLRRVVARLLTYDYVSGVFVDDKYGPVAGTLPLSTIHLAGSSRVPRPAAVVAFKVFYLDPANLQTAIQVSDASLEEGQGMHGGFGRESTWNNMAALGPHFKRGFVDRAPVGNADIAPTLAHLLGFEMSRGAPGSGRVLTEALAGGPVPDAPQVRYLRSSTAVGKQTIIAFQEHAGVRYLDRGCFTSPEVPDAASCR